MRILVVEDELDLAGVIKSALAREQFIADHVVDIGLALEAIVSNAYGCVILDRKLGDGDGLTLLPEIRRHLPGVPVVVLSALRASHEKIDGLNRGADDYLEKPFVVNELIARVRAIIRRSPHLVAPTVCVGRLAMNAAQGATTIGGQPFILSRREYLILEALMRRPGLVVRRSALMEHVYAWDDQVQENSLDAHVSRLRKKLVDQAAEAEIHTIRALGYLIKAVDPEPD